MTTARSAPRGRLLAVVAAAGLLPGLVSLPATATSRATPASAATPASVATPASAAKASAATGPGGSTASPATVRRPSVREVPLAGVDRAVLAAAPDPEPRAHGTVAALSADVRVRPAVAARVRISAPASLVAVTADAPFPAGSTIQVRVRENKRWSAWTALEVDPEHGPDPRSAEAAGVRTGSDPLLAVDPDRAQVRIDTPSGTLPRGTELTLVSAPSATSHASAPSGRVSAMATVGMPPIVTRAQWGADESLRGRAPAYTSNVRAGFVHHTASTSNYSPSQAAAQVRAIYGYHTRSLGHSDIDYNFLVDRFGRLYEGRHGGVDRPVLGAHTAGFNEHTFAISALGNFSAFSPGASNMAAMKDSIARLFAWKLGLHGVNPGATVSLVSAGYRKATRYPRGSVATISAVSSHQTVNFTACPGTNLQAQLASIRSMAASYSRVVISAPSPAGQTIRSGDTRSVTLRSAANRAVRWTADVLTPCSDTPVRSFSGATAGAGAIALTWDLRDSKGSPVLPATYTIRMSGRASDGTPVATVTTDLTIAPAPGGAWGPCANASRVTGTSPAATSVLWGRISAPRSRVVVVTGQPQDSAAAHAAGLAAAPLARSLGAPLLLTPAGALAGEVAQDIRARGATQVILVGGPSVVSTSSAGAVAGLGAAVTRLAGRTDAATAAAVAGRMGRSASAVLVSPHGSPAHALAGAGLAAARAVPVLFASGDSVPAETRAALAGRTSVTVAAPTGLSDSAVSRALSGVPWTRLVGADAVAASLAVAGAFPGTARSVMLLPEAPASWAAGPVAASGGVPVLFTTSPVLAPSVAAFLIGHPALRATTTPVSAGWLDDQVLGATSRLLLGLPWSPPGVSTGVSTRTPATPTAKRKVARANATPEPVRRGRTITVRARVTAKHSDGKWRAAPAGVAFALQFKASGSKRYKVIARGATTEGRATATAKAGKSGRWRIVVGTKKSRSDHVRVRR